jgi:hypothetical protein
VVAGEADQLGGVGGDPGDGQARPLEHPHDALADEGLVLPDDDPERWGHDPRA